MPDIRDVLNALDETDQTLYTQTRTRIRKAYLKAVSEIVGIDNLNESDDQILDWIDVKIGSLFDRAGRFDGVKGRLGDVKEVEAKIEIDGAKTLEKAIAAKVGNGWANGNGTHQ